MKVRTASIERHATDQPPANLAIPPMVQAGAREYAEHGCATCHGAPGVTWAKFSEGLHPDPPDLKEVVGERSPSQLFWVIKNGINMTGMPSFGAAGVQMTKNLGDRRLPQEAADRLGGGLQGLDRARGPTGSPGSPAAAPAPPAAAPPPPAAAPAPPAGEHSSPAGLLQSRHELFSSLRPRPWATGPGRRLGWMLALANVALAAAQFAEPVLFGRIIDALAGAQVKPARPTGRTCGAARRLGRLRPVHHRLRRAGRAAMPTGWRIAAGMRC